MLVRKRNRVSHCHVWWADTICLREQPLVTRIPALCRPRPFIQPFSFRDSILWGKSMVCAVICLWTWLPTEDSLVPQGVFGNVWRNFGLSQFGGGGTSAWLGERPATLLNTLSSSSRWGIIQPKCCRIDVGRFWCTWVLTKVPTIPKQRAN